MSHGDGVSDSVLVSFTFRVTDAKFPLKQQPPPDPDVIEAEEALSSVLLVPTTEQLPPPRGLGEQSQPGPPQSISSLLVDVGPGSSNPGPSGQQHSSRSVAENPGPSNPQGYRWNGPEYPGQVVRPVTGFHHAGPLGGFGYSSQPAQQGPSSRSGPPVQQGPSSSRSASPAQQGPSPSRSGPPAQQGPSSSRSGFPSSCPQQGPSRSGPGFPSPQPQQSSPWGVSEFPALIPQKEHSRRGPGFPSSSWVVSEIPALIPQKAPSPALNPRKAAPTPGECDFPCLIPEKGPNWGIQGPTQILNGPYRPSNAEGKRVAPIVEEKVVTNQTDGPLVHF